MKTEVLCIQPPIYDFALYDLFLKPYGLLRIARWFRMSGYNVTVLNALDYEDPFTEAVLGKARRKSNGTGKFHRMPIDLPDGIKRIKRRFGRYGILPEVFEARVRQSKPGLVLITSQMTYWYLGVAEAVRIVKKYHPGVPVAVGGVYATLMPEHCREYTGADEVVEGDFFLRLPSLLERWGFPAPEDLSDGGTGLSFPAACKTSRDELFPLMEASVWKDAGVVRLNTGCPYRCTYCASHSIEPGFRAGNYRRAFEYIREMYESLHIRNFAFYDDALLVRKEEVLLPLLEEILRHDMKLRIYTPNAVHMSCMDYETARLMKRSGFQEVRLGYESADEDFHQQFDTKYRPEEVPEAIDVLRKAGFTGSQLILYILAGLPRQDISEVLQSLRTVSGFKVRVSIAEYSPVPRTALWDKAVESSSYPIETEPLYHNNTFFPMEWEGFSRSGLQRVKDMARRMETG